MDEYKCPRCGSSVFRVRTRSNTAICIKCGHTWPNPYTKEEK